MRKAGVTRRTLLGGLGAGLAASALVKAQQDPFHDHSRVPAMDELKTVIEFEAVAFAKLPRETWTYTAYGAEGEFTLRRNREAFDWVELVPRGVVDVSSVKTATTVLGTPMNFPMMVSPSAAHGALYRDGEIGTHQGASAASGTPMIISANASFPVDKIAAGGTSPIWWQLYPQEDLDHTKDLLDRALAAGAKAIVMTVDQQASYYEHSLHDRHLNAAPLGGGVAGTGGGRGPGGGRGAQGAAAAVNPYRVPQARLWYNWQYADQVRKMVNVPLAVKGVLTAEDAKEFVSHGFDAYLRIQSRRQVHGLRSVHIGSTGRNRRCRSSTCTGAVRQRHPKWLGHPQGSRAGRQSRLSWPHDPVGSCCLRAGGGTACARNSSGRTHDGDGANGKGRPCVDRSQLDKDAFPMKKNDFTRRQVLAGLGSLAVASPLLADQPPQLIGEPPGRIAPRADLVNVLEFEDMAKRQLAPPIFDSDCRQRSFFLRPDHVPSSHDGTHHAYGYEPPVVWRQDVCADHGGAVAKLQTYHPDGEAGMARAASAAKAWMVVSSDSSMPFEKIAAESSTVLWYQVFPDGDISGVNAKMAQAVKSGCKAICITTGFPFPDADAGAGPAKLAAMTHSAVNWDVIDKMRKGINVPVLIKGIMTPEEANTAVKRGVQGIVVSNYGGLLTPGMASSMEMLPSIAKVVAGKIPVLIDGSFRRGSDIFKALAYGATAVMIARPLAWGLAAYGPEGAQQILEMLQTEVGRDMAQSGKPTLADIDRSVVKLHEV